MAVLGAEGWMYLSPPCMCPVPLTSSVRSTPRRVGHRPSSTSNTSIMQRSSSIPRTFHKRPSHITIHVAVKLMLQLQKLDALLNETDLSLHKELAFVDEWTCPTEADINLAVKTNETAHDFQLLLQRLQVLRPDGIVSAFEKAYNAALRGQQYVNEDKIIDFTKGRECTCSVALNVLPEIDLMIGTRLAARFESVYAKGNSHRFCSCPIPSILTSL